MAAEVHRGRNHSSITSCGTGRLLIHPQVTGSRRIAFSFSREKANRRPPGILARARRFPPGRPGGKLSNASQDVITSRPIRPSRPSATSACAPPQSFITSVTSRSSSSSRNSATRWATPRTVRSASGRIGLRWPPRGSVGTTHLKSERRSATTWRQSEPFIATPCSRTTTGPSPPVSSYSTTPAESVTSVIRPT